MQEEAAYICDSCGEEIVIPVDVTAGADQEYIGASFYGQHLKGIQHRLKFSMQVSGCFE